MQIKELMERCVIQLKSRLTLDNLIEVAVLAERLHHDGLHNALVTFARQKENRCAHHVASVFPHVPHVSDIVSMRQSM